MSDSGRRAAVVLACVSAALVLAAAAALLRPYRIHGGSMAPGLRDGDVVLVLARPRTIRRGEVVIVSSRLGTYVKRVAGLPHEVVEVRDGIVLADGAPADVPGPRRAADDAPPTQLGADEYYVLGDARGEGFDSRAFGPVARSEIAGRVLVRAWPPVRRPPPRR